MECRKEVAVEQWKSDPDGLLSDLQKLDDPLEQVAVIEAVSEAWPGETGPLCRTLPPGAARSRCERINMRPHLAARGGAGQGGSGGPTTPSAVDSSAAVVQDPGMTLLIPSKAAAFATSPWESTPPAKLSCPDGTPDHTCRVQAAEKAGRQGQAEAAAAACMGIEAGQWRQECFFDAAEAAAGEGGDTAAKTAATLCEGSGDFLANCLAHTAMGLAAAAPTANASAQGSWIRVIGGARGVQDALRDQDADLAARVAERVWSEATLRAYLGVSEVTGDPLTQLPEVAWPHVRAAAAWQLVALAGPQSWTLEQWTTRLHDALGKHNFRPVQGRPSADRGVSVGNLWAQLMPGEEVFHAILYLGQARRVVASDADSDEIVCLLEALARRPELSAQPLFDALDSPSPEVRWTAARLLQAVDRSGTASARLAQNPDPLVRGRAGPLPPPVEAAGR